MLLIKNIRAIPPYQISFPRYEKPIFGYRGRQTERRHRIVI